MSRDDLDFAIKFLLFMAAVILVMGSCVLSLMWLGLKMGLPL